MRTQSNCTNNNNKKRTNKWERFNENNVYWYCALPNSTQFIWLTIERDDEKAQKKKRSEIKKNRRRDSIPSGTKCCRSISICVSFLRFNHLLCFERKRISVHFHWISRNAMAIVITKHKGACIKNRFSYTLQRPCFTLFRHTIMLDHLMKPFALWAHKKILISWTGTFSKDVIKTKSLAKRKRSLCPYQRLNLLVKLASTSNYSRKFPLHETAATLPSQSVGNEIITCSWNNKCVCLVLVY